MKSREFRIAAKAGAVTGLLIGGFFIPSLVLFEALIWYSGSLVKALPAIVAGYLLLGVIIIVVISIIPATLILSLIGVLFAIVEKWIPCESASRKSLLVFVILWMLLYVVLVPVGWFVDFRIVSFTLVWDLLFAMVFAHFLKKYRGDL